MRETVQLALEARHRTGVPVGCALPAALHPHGAQAAHRGGRADRLLGLGRYGDSYISDLSTGTRASSSSPVCWRSMLCVVPGRAAGLAQRETEAFGPVIIDIRRQLDASVLVIEHDMPLIMGISDRVYCLELGVVIAEGQPDQVRNDPAVIASYLGTDERAIARSGSAGEASPAIDLDDPVDAPAVEVGNGSAD